MALAADTQYSLPFHPYSHATTSLTPRAKQTQNKHNVTELTLSSSADKSLELILPTLAHLSRQSKNRWLTWITPKGFSKSDIQAYGFDLSKVRLITSKGDKQAQELMERALNLGNSDAVIGQFEQLPEGAIRCFEAAASSGNCNGMVLRFHAYS